MENEIDLIRYGKILDLLHLRSGDSKPNARHLIENKVTRTIENGAFTDALSANYERLKWLAPRSADSIFDEELSSSLARREPPDEIRRQARDETKYLIPFACVRQEAV